MSGISSRFGGAREPVTDPFDVVAGLTPLRAAARGGDWAATQAFFDGLGSVDEACFAADALASVDGTEAYLEAAAKDRPGDPLARTLLAERYTHIGWSIRSGARAKHVSREQFGHFHDWLRRAEQILIEVCAEHPGYAPAWTSRLLTARGLQLGQSESRRRYDRSAATHPHCFRPQRQLLQQLCPKWGGSREAMHGFAQECASAAPEGSPAAILIAEAHFEHALDLPTAEYKEYLRDVSVRAELRRAARMSVLHPEQRLGWYLVSGHSVFALVFSLGGHAKDAAPHFAALGNTLCDTRWGYLNDWPTAYAKHRATALATLDNAKGARR